MASELEGHESARGFWEILKSVLTNERGAVGTDEGGSEAEDGGDWSAEGELSEADQIKEPADQPKTLPITEPEEEVEEQEEEPEESEPEVEAEAEEEVEEEEPQETTAMRAELETLRQQNAFFQARYNELTAATRQPKPAAPAQTQEAAPEGQQFEAPPESWEKTEDVVSFFDKRSSIQTQQALERGFNEVVQPMFQKFNEALSEVINRAVKPNLSDFDSIINDVHNQIFVMDKDGKQAVAIKNQGLLDYFSAQKVPELAMYDWGLSQKAPQKIKEGTKKATKDLVSKIKKKPKAPKSISSASQPGKEADSELDWDTPPDQVEKILDKKRMI